MTGLGLTPEFLRNYKIPRNPAPVAGVRNVPSPLNHVAQSGRELRRRHLEIFEARCVYCRHFHSADTYCFRLRRMSEDGEASPSPRRGRAPRGRRARSRSASGSPPASRRRQTSRTSSSSSSEEEDRSPGYGRARTKEPSEGELEDEAPEHEGHEAGDDAYGPNMDEEALEDLLRENRRADDKEITLRLNNTMLKIFNKKLVGDGKWNRDTCDDMKDKYYMSEEQHEALRPPSLQGTRLYMHGLEFGGLGTSMKKLHRSARDVAKVSLREYELIVKDKNILGEWGPESVQVLDQKGSLMDAFAVPPIVDYAASEDEITGIVEAAGEGDTARSLAATIIRQRQCLTDLAHKYGEVAALYSKARRAALCGMELQENLSTLHWDGLQFLGQHDLLIAEMRR